MDERREPLQVEGGRTERPKHRGLRRFLIFLAVLAAVLGVVLSAYPSLSARFLMYHTVCLLCVLVTVSAVRTASAKSSVTRMGKSLR